MRDCYRLREHRVLKVGAERVDSKDQTEGGGALLGEERDLEEMILKTETGAKSCGAFQSRSGNLFLKDLEATEGFYVGELGRSDYHFLKITLAYDDILFNIFHL